MFMVLFPQDYMAHPHFIRLSKSVIYNVLDLLCRQLIIYNYNLACHLCKLLTPFIPIAHCTKGSFTFIKDIQEVSTKDAFMVTYDVPLD